VSNSERETTGNLMMVEYDDYISSKKGKTNKLKMTLSTIVKTTEIISNEI